MSDAKTERDGMAQRNHLAEVLRISRFVDSIRRLPPPQDPAFQHGATEVLLDLAQSAVNSEVFGVGREPLERFKCRKCGTELGELLSLVRFFFPYCTRCDPEIAGANRGAAEQAAIDKANLDAVYLVNGQLKAECTALKAQLAGCKSPGPRRSWLKAGGVLGGIVGALIMILVESVAIYRARQDGRVAAAIEALVTLAKEGCRP